MSKPLYKAGTQKRSVEQLCRDVLNKVSNDNCSASPYLQMVAKNYTIAVFKDGKLIAADADVYTFHCEDEDDEGNEDIKA